MSAKWVHDGRVEVGTFCTTQGEIQPSHSDTLFTRSVRSYQDDWSNNRRAFHICESDFISVWSSPHLNWVQLIALYTFVGLWMMKGISSMKNTVVLVVGIVASTVTLAVIALATHIDPSKPNFMGPTPVMQFLNSLSQVAGF